MVNIDGGNNLFGDVSYPIFVNNSIISGYSIYLDDLMVHQILDPKGNIVELNLNELFPNEVAVFFKQEPSGGGVYFLEILIDNKIIHKKIIFNK